jgi:hypothetical protein
VGAARPAAAARCMSPNTPHTHITHTTLGLRLIILTDVKDLLKSRRPPTLVKTRAAAAGDGGQILKRRPGRVGGLQEKRAPSRRRLPRGCCCMLGSPPSLCQWPRGGGSGSRSGEGEEGRGETGFLVPGRWLVSQQATDCVDEGRRGAKGCRRFLSSKSHTHGLFQNGAPAARSPCCMRTHARAPRGRLRLAKREGGGEGGAAAAKQILDQGRTSPLELPARALAERGVAGARLSQG